MNNMKRSEFQRVIQQALDELPPPFQDALHNIDIQVRWRPTVHELRQALSKVSRARIESKTS